MSALSHAQPFSVPPLALSTTARFNPRCGSARAAVTAGRVPDPIEYIELRRRVGGAPWSALLVEHTVGEIPPRLVDTRPLHVVTDTFADAVHLRNDLFSYQREIEQEAEPHNAVLVAQRFLGHSAQQAATMVADLITSRLRLFEHAATVEMAETLSDERATVAERHQVAAYVQGLRDWQAGGHEWHCRSSRYMNTPTRSRPHHIAPGATGPGVSLARTVRPVTGLRVRQTAILGPEPPLRAALPLPTVPFPVRISPHLERVRTHDRAWARRLGLLEPVPGLARSHVWTDQDIVDFDIPTGTEIPVDIIAGRDGEHPLPTAFVDYTPDPPEHELHAAQTILRVHSRVAHLYNGPCDQVEQQIRLIIHALRERQEHEMVNDEKIGLLHVVAPRHRLSATDRDTLLDALDQLLGLRRNPHLFLAHPRAIVALGQECTRRGLTVQFREIDGHQVPAWRGVPIFPCNKIPITDTATTSVIVMRTGEHDQGVVGLHQSGLPDEWEPSLNVQFMGIDRMGVIHYLISAYYSLDVLVPDALGVLDNVPLTG